MKKQRTFRIIFALYLCVMVYLMFLQRIGTEHAHTVPHYNLIPLEGIRIFAENLLGDDPYWVRHAVINLVGNVVMFVPAGFLVPRISGRLSTLVRVLAVCFGALMCAEVLQLISLLGSFDVDDIILNMAGVLIGFGLHKACTKTKKDEV